MPKMLPISDKREWYAPKDVENVYGISRESLFRIMQDAKEKGMPIKTAVLDFKNGSTTTRKRPFIRIQKKSLDAYLEAHMEEECLTEQG